MSTSPSQSNVVIRSRDSEVELLGFESLFYHLNLGQVMQPLCDSALPGESAVTGPTL